MINTTRLTKRYLEEFTGSENWYQHSINRDVLYTDGARHVADGQRLLTAGRDRHLPASQRVLRDRTLPGVEAHRTARPDGHTGVLRR